MNAWDNKRSNCRCTNEQKYSNEYVDHTKVYEGSGSVVGQCVELFIDIPCGGESSSEFKIFQAPKPRRTSAKYILGVMDVPSRCLTLELSGTGGVRLERVVRGRPRMKLKYLA